MSEQDFVRLPSLSVAAHELKSPIALMRQLALAIQTGDLTAEQERIYGDRLVLMADRSLRIANDLAQMANIQPSLFPLEPINPLAVCRSLHLSMNPVAKAYGKRIIWPKNRKVDLVAANDRLLSSVVSNFIDNALKYSDDSTPIRVGVATRDGRVRVSVRDFGPQIALRDYRSLVDELSQPKVFRTRPDSSGLGIYIASQFAQAMGGGIGLTRHRDGATFYVDLAISTQMRLV